MSGNGQAGRRLYVYYQVALSDLAAVQVAAQAMQADLVARHRGLHAELLRRPGIPGDSRITLMEIYAIEAGGQGISDTVGRDIERAALSLAPWLHGTRHIEVFEKI